METQALPRIAFYDSGIGGLPYFKKTREYLHQADYLYYADAANFPLGEKSRDEVNQLVREAIAGIIAGFNPQAVVIACNTASLAALADLRRDFPSVNFIGTVPAVKPAAARSKSRKIAVLATSRTIEDPYTAGLVNQFAGGVETSLIAVPQWVEFVEASWLDSSPQERAAVVAPQLMPLLDSGVDEIVLACTHFLFLEEDLRALSGSRAEIIDSAEGVSKRVAELCRDSGQENPGNSEARARLYSSGSPSELHRRFAERFGLSYGGSFS